MTRLPVLNGKEIIRILQKIGYQEVSQRGSHVRLKCEGKKSITVPNHIVGRGLLRKILRDTHLSPEEFITLLKN